MNLEFAYLPPSHLGSNFEVLRLIFLLDHVSGNSHMREGVSWKTNIQFETNNRLFVKVDMDRMSGKSDKTVEYSMSDNLNLKVFGMV